jgi:hypothetical protein
MYNQTILFFILDNKPQQNLNGLIPLFTFVAGLLFGVIQKKWDEAKTLERYEHAIIVDILDILNDNTPSKRMQILYDQLKRDSSYFKTKNYNIIRMAISEGLDDNKKYTDELEKIRTGFENKFKKS